MKLLCITSMNGSLTNVRPEAEWFIGLHRNGAQVTLMTESDAPYAEIARDAGLGIIDFRSDGKLHRGSISAVRHAAAGMDVVFAMNNKAIANAVAALRGLAPRLVTYRGQTGNISRWNPGCYLTHLNRRVDAIVCVADAVRRSIAGQLRRPDKAITIYKGHDLAWYEDVQPADRGALGITDSLPVIICVSNYRPRKGIETLIDSFATLERDVHLVLVGSGMDDPSLRRRALAHIPESRLHTPGFCADALPLTAAADIAVLPALRREGLPKTVIEAMSLGVVPVVTDTGGNAELVADGETGLVVPPGEPAVMADALRRLCDEPSLRQRYGRAARERIDREFNIETTVRETLDAFHSLVTTGSPRAAAGQSSR